MVAFGPKLFISSSSSDGHMGGQYLWGS